MHSCMFQHSYTVLYNPSKLNIYQYLYSGVGAFIQFFFTFYIKFQRVNFIFIIVCINYNGIVIFILENQINCSVAPVFILRLRAFLIPVYVLCKLIHSYVYLCIHVRFY